MLNIILCLSHKWCYIYHKKCMKKYTNCYETQFLPLFISFLMNTVSVLITFEHTLFTNFIEDLRKSNIWSQVLNFYIFDLKDASCIRRTHNFIKALLHTGEIIFYLIFIENYFEAFFARIISCRYDSHRNKCLSLFQLLFKWIYLIIPSRMSVHWNRHKISEPFKGKEMGLPNMVFMFFSV